MAYAVSAYYLRFDHMSPTAAGMAAALHLLTALALWWVSPLKHIDIDDQPIEVTMEEPAAPKAEAPPPPQPPATPPGTQAEPKPTPPPAVQPTARSGVPPVEAKPTPTEKSSVPLGVKPPSERTTEPPQTAAAQPPPPPKEAPPVEPSSRPELKLPQVETPPAPLSMQDFVRAAPPPPPQEIVRPQPRVQPTPPPAAPTVQQTPAKQFAPSPLGQPPQQQRTPADSQAAAALVNPADAAARSRAVDEYVWAVIRKFSQYLPDLREKNEGGAFVVRLVIARDGRVLEAAIAKSSGVPALDKGMLDTIRAAAPYAALPPELPGNSVTFTLPFESRFAR